MKLSPARCNMRYIRTCEVCGIELPDNAVFCGNCGTPIVNSPEAPTSGSVPAVKIHSGDSAPTINAPQWEYAPPNANWQSLEDEEEEENRRDALFGLPPQGMYPPAGNVPMVQGSP